MAKFKEGDWVEITSTPDKKWQRWSNNPEYYDNFAGKVGIIAEIDSSKDPQGNILYKIGVEFQRDIRDGYSTLPAGKYYEWFMDKHLLNSSKYEAEIRKERAKAAVELQEWEKFKKKSTDDALRKVFAPEIPKKEEKTLEVDDPYDPWNVATNPNGNYTDQWGPDYNSLKKDDDEYDTNMLDFLNPNDPYFYSDD
jgi:hypothetical protein